MKAKALAAAVTLAMAGAAQAAIDDDNIPALGSNTFSGTGGQGELFISIVARGPDGTDNSIDDATYVRDLGITADLFVNALNAGTLSSLSIPTFSADTLLTNFLSANAGKDISFNVLGVHNGPEFDPVIFTSVDVGFLTSASESADAVAAKQPVGAAGFNTPSVDVSNHVNGINVKMGSDVALDLSATYVSGEFGHHDNNYGRDRTFGFDTEGALGGALDFYFIGLDNLDNSKSRTPDFIGSWTLSSAGDLSFQAVPVPAAVWLLGSALIGLAGVARRRKA